MAAAAGEEDRQGLADRTVADLDHVIEGGHFAPLIAALAKHVLAPAPISSTLAASQRK